MSDFLEPIGNEEAILQNILGANNELLPPMSRNEKILLDILGEDYPIDPPMSRMEALLIALKEKIEHDTPSGKITITENGTDINIAQYATADVDVSSADLGTKNITANGEYAASEDNLDGYSAVTVTVPIPTDTTATAADINLGKTAYVAGGKVTGTNDYVKPEKGFYFLDCDDDGFYHTVVLKDCLSNYNFRGTFTTNGIPTFGKKVENVHVYGVMTPVSAFTDNNGPKHYYLYGDNIRVGNNTFSGNRSAESVVFNGNVSLIYTDAFGLNNATMLYDFSQNTGVPSLTNLRALGHASGCVLKVPLSLLTEWQEETNWIDLPTDPEVSGYVVWQGV